MPEVWVIFRGPETCFFPYVFSHLSKKNITLLFGDLFSTTVHENLKNATLGRTQNIENTIGFIRKISLGPGRRCHFGGFSKKCFSICFIDVQETLVFIVSNAYRGGSFFDPFFYFFLTLDLFWKPSILTNISYFATGQTKYCYFYDPGDSIFHTVQFINFSVFQNVRRFSCVRFLMNCGSFLAPVGSLLAHLWPTLAPLLVFFSIQKQYGLIEPKSPN